MESKYSIVFFYRKSNRGMKQGPLVRMMCWLKVHSTGPVYCCIRQTEKNTSSPHRSCSEARNFFFVPYYRFSRCYWKTKLETDDLLDSAGARTTSSLCCNRAGHEGHFKNIDDTNIFTIVHMILLYQIFSVRIWLTVRYLAQPRKVKMRWSHNGTEISKRR